jgi:hypothetical protein
MSKLYRVHVSTDVVVLADSVDEAERMALKVVSGGLSTDALDHDGASEVSDVNYLPVGWDALCIPYRSKTCSHCTGSGEKTIGELLGAKW